MSRRKISSTLKMLFLLTSALLFFLFHSVKAGSMQPSADLKEEGPASITKSTVSLSLTPLKKRSFLNSDLTSHHKSEEKSFFVPFSLTSSLTGSEKESYPHLPKIIVFEHKQSFLYTSSLVTLTLLNVADYFSTTRALKYEGLNEGNPLMKPFVKNTLIYTTIKLGLTAYNYYFLKDLYKKNKKLAWVVTITANVFLSYAVINNISKIREVQRR